MTTAAKKDEKAEQKATPKAAEKAEDKRDEKAEKEAEKAAEKRQKEIEKSASTQLSDTQGELRAAHLALATIRKHVLERPSVTSGEIIQIIADSGVDSSEFDKIAAGV